MSCEIRLVGRRGLWDARKIKHPQYASTPYFGRETAGARNAFITPHAKSRDSGETLDRPSPRPRFFGFCESSSFDFIEPRPPYIPTADSRQGGHCQWQREYNPCDRTGQQRTEVKPDGARKTRGETREGGSAEQKDQENLHFLLVRL